MTLRTMLLICLLPAAATASQEQILAPSGVSLEAKAGAPFGKVKVSMQVKGPCFKQRITSMTIQVAGRWIAVPRAALGDLRNVVPNTIEIRRERGWGKHPWLYVTFQLEPRPHVTDPRRRPRVYLAIQKGKLVHRSISQRLPGGKRSFEQKKL